MALLHCPECNKEISTMAQVCPHCGLPQTVSQQRQSGTTEMPPPTKKTCPLCSGEMRLQRNMGTSIFLAIFGIVAFFASWPITKEIIQMIRVSNYQVNWESAAPWLAAPLLAVFLLYRASTHSQYRLVCKECKKEVWK